MSSAVAHAGAAGPAVADPAVLRSLQDRFAGRLALAEPYDVVLADAHMPGDGMVLLERLEAMPRLKGRTVLMTGDHVPSLGEGMADRPHLSKPFDMTEVIRLVETIGR